MEILIEEQADVNAKDKSGLTPAHYAARNGHLKILKILINKKADVKVKDEDGRTPIDYARSVRKRNIVDFLEQ